MKNPTLSQNSPSANEATQYAILQLQEAKATVQEIVQLRIKEKMSYTRASNVAREINEIIKVLSLYMPLEK